MALYRRKDGFRHVIRTADEAIRPTLTQNPPLSRSLAQLLQEHCRLDYAGMISRELRQLHSALGALDLDEIIGTRWADYASDRMNADTKSATVRRDPATLGLTTPGVGEPTGEP